MPSRSASSDRRNSPRRVQRCAVEIGQHDRAEIALLRLRRRGVETDAERRRIVGQELGQRAGLHAVGEARAAFRRAVVGAPERCRETRHEHEARRGERKAAREQERADAKLGAQRMTPVVRRRLQRDERREQQDQRQGHADREHERLREEERAHQDESAEADRDARVARMFGLEELQGEQAATERAAGFAPEQRAVVHDDQDEQQARGRQTNDERRRPAAATA